MFLSKLTLLSLELLLRLGNPDVRFLHKADMKGDLLNCINYKVGQVPMSDMM